MANKKENQEALLLWKVKTQEIHTATAVGAPETAKTKAIRIKALKSDYNKFCRYYFPHYCKADCASFQVKDAKAILADKNIFAVLEWPRGHAKSTHADIFIPLWLKVNGELDGMVLIGKSEKAAIKLLGDVQAELQFNQRFINDYGDQVTQGDWQEGDFTTNDGVNFIAIGRGQTPRGIRKGEKRPNYVVPDDIDDDELVRNESRVDEVVDYLLGSVLGGVEINNGRFVMAGNRIHRKSVLAKIVGDIDEHTPKRAGVYHSKIYAAYNKFNSQPATPPLNLDTDVPAWPEHYSIEALKKRMDTMGVRLALREYFHKHVIMGLIFKEEWIRWGKVLPIHKYDYVVAYFDPSFTGNKSSDYKAIVIAGIFKSKIYIIKMFCRQCGIGEAARWLYDQWETILKPVDMKEANCDLFMESGFIQQMLLDAFVAEGLKRGFQIPIHPDKRDKPNKEARIESIAPLWENEHVIYNDDERQNEDMITGIEQTVGFGQGARMHDDAPDAIEGAIYKLTNKMRHAHTEIRLGVRKQQKW